jgi:hypothetical protein
MNMDPDIQKNGHGFTNSNFRSSTIFKIHKMAILRDLYFLNLSVAFKNTFWSKIQRNIMQIDNSRIINYDTFGVAILQNLQPLKHAVF